MRSLKNHLGFILPLIALLFSVQFSLTADKIVREYERLMGNDYNIVVVSNKELSEPVLKPVVSTLASIEPLSPQKIIDRLSNDISAKNLSILQNALPKFYSLRLSEFPSPEYMEEIKQKLLKFDGISKVETFSKTHDKVFKMLNLAKSISYAFMAILCVVGLMLMLKQAKIWLFEHRERIEIMTLFGAPFWLKSAMLYKSAMVDSIVATIVVGAFFFFLPSIEIFRENAASIDVVLPSLDISRDIFILFGVAVVLSIFAVSLVMSKARKSTI